MAIPVGGAGRCIGLVELASIAAGLQTVDALLKQADVELLLCRAVTPGKYVVLFSGEVDAVTSSLRRALEVGQEWLIDRLFLANIEPTLLTLVRRALAAPSAAPAMAGSPGGHDQADRPGREAARNPAGSGDGPEAGFGSEAADSEGPPTLDALGIIETLSVASLIRAADIASKLASLTLVSLELARGIGGKCYVTFTGEVSDVDAAVSAAAAEAESGGMLVRRVVIPRPHEAMLAVLGGGPDP